MKPAEFVVSLSFWLDALNLNWLGVIGGPPLHNFGEVDFLALHPTLQSKKKKKECS